MNLAQLLGALEPVAYAGCGPDTRVTGVTTDSRRVEPGMAFLAIHGATHDGHAFVTAALEAGAVAVIVDAGAQLPEPHVLLRDTAAAHPEIAANAHGRPGDRLALAAVTGTNGKTTTAHLVGAMLGAAGHGFTRLGTTGNWVVDHEETAEFTTPFPVELQGLLARAVDSGATHGVMEVSSHALAQSRVEPLRFAAVGLTSFSQDHLDFHPNMEAYLEAKLLLASRYLDASGVAVAAVDRQPAAQKFLASSRGRTWRASRGADPDAEIRAREVLRTAHGTRAEVETPSGTMQLRSPLIGDFNLDNLLVGIGLGLGLGVELPAIERALKTAAGAPGRLERVAGPGAKGPVVVVDYAHTPDAVERAIGAVRGITAGSLVVVLGCGGDRDASKRPQMGAVAARLADRFFATSDNPRTEDPVQIVDQMLAGLPAGHGAEVIREVDRARAIATAIAEAGPQDVVLVAGKGHEDYQIVGTTRNHFDDREHARAALALRP